MKIIQLYKGLLTSIALIISACQLNNTPHPVLERAEQLMSDRPDSALVLLQDSIDSSGLSGKNYADWCLLLTQAKDKCYKPQDSDSLIRVACEYYEAHPDPERLTLAYYYMGRVNQGFGNALQAQDSYLRAIEESESSQNLAIKARIYSNLGMLYNHMEVYYPALAMMKKAEACLTQLRDTASLAFIWRDMGRAYEQLHKPDSALIYYHQALPVSTVSSRSAILNEMGSIYAAKGAFSEAFNYLQEALQTVTPPYHQSETVYLTLGEAYGLSNRPDSARYYLNKSLHSTNEQTNAAAYYHLYHLEKRANNLKAYALAQEKYEQLKDASWTEENKTLIHQVQGLHEYRQMENKAKVAAYQRAISQRNLSFTLATAIFLAAILSGGLYYAYNRKQEWKRQAIRYQQLLDKQQTIHPHMEENTESIENEKENDEDTQVNKKLGRLFASALYSDLCNKDLATGEITETDWIELEKALNKIYPGLRTNLRILDPGMLQKYLYMTYLIIVDVKITRIGKLLSIQHISKVRKRLFKKLTGQDGSAEDYDKLVKNLAQKQLSNKAEKYK